MEEVPELIPLIFSHILSTAPLPLGIDLEARSVAALFGAGEDSVPSFTSRERPPLVGAGFFAHHHSSHPPLRYF